MTPFYATKGFHPNFDPTFPVTPQVPAAEIRIAQLQRQHQDLQEQLKLAQESYKKYADTHRMAPPTLNIGDKVWLLSKNVNTTRPSKKLDYTKLGPYEILQQIGSVAYKLNLPTTTDIHPVFHVSLLEPYISNTIPDRIPKPPPPVIINNDQEYEVETVLDSRYYKRQLQYYVLWKDYPSSESSWEPASYLKHCQDKVQEFHQLHPQKPNSRSKTKKSKKSS
jgi:hypothetical protein